MRKPGRLLFRFGGLSGAALLIAAAVSLSPSPGRSPYRSALAALATGSIAQAAPGCSNKTCDATGTRCVHLNGSRTNCGVGDFCRTFGCL